MRLDGKVAIVTGASEGIGAALAAGSARAWRDLSLVARSEDKLRQVGGKDALITAGDLLDAATRAWPSNGRMDRFGRIDLLINNAGAGLYARLT